MMVALLAKRPQSHRLARQSENSPRVLVPQTLVLTKRMLLRWSRDLPTVLQTLIVPILLLVTLEACQWLRSSRRSRDPRSALSG
jgi:ABC-2 type transport system permease protein